MQNLFQRSSLTLANAKQYIAEQAGKQQTDEMKARAGRSLISTLQAWNKFNWSWLLTTANLSVGTAGTASLPFNFKDVYDLRWAGDTSRWIPARTRRAYTRTVYNKFTTVDEPVSYHLFSSGTGGVLELQNSSASGTATLAYYRRMTLPCSVTASALKCVSGSSFLWTSAASALSGIYIGNPIALSTGWATGSSYTITAIKNELDPTGGNTLGTSIYLDASASASSASVSVTAGGENYFLDIPQDYEWDIMTGAILHFMIGVGGPRDKIVEWKEKAMAGLDRALMDDRTEEDLDLAFQPSPDQPRKQWTPTTVYE